MGSRVHQQANDFFLSVVRTFHSGEVWIIYDT